MKKNYRFDSGQTAGHFSPVFAVQVYVPVSVLKKHIYVLTCFSFLNLYILRFVEGDASEGDDSSCEDSKTMSENETKKTRASETTEKRQPAIGKLLA